MIRSMTGYGRAERSESDLRIAAEVRTINNRGLKLYLRLPEGLTRLEMPLEKIIRSRVARGTVNLTVKIDAVGPEVEVPVNRNLLSAYWRELSDWAEGLTTPTRPETTLDGLLALPGVVGEAEGLLAEIENLEDRVRPVVEEALDRLDEMRAAEGRATAEDMRTSIETIDAGIAAVRERAPQVVEEYRDKLTGKIQKLLEGTDIGLDDASLVREVAYFAERCDVNEELSRLESHLAQFREALEADEPAGRRIEFLTQEMYREVNTIGSKSSDADVGRQGVEMKVAVDRLREQAQNIE